MAKKIRRAESAGLDGWWVKPCEECPDSTGHYFLNSAIWTLNGDEENPTLSPSLRCPCRGGGCHYYVRDGKQHHCSDSRFPNAVRDMREFEEGE